MTRSVEVDGESDAIVQVVDLINNLKSSYPDVTQVGVAVAGLVDRSTGKVAFSAHRPEHSNLDLAGQIRSSVGLDAVIENDANAAAFGEYRLGAGRESENFFYATLGEGVGVRSFSAASFGMERRFCGGIRLCADQFRGNAARRGRVQRNIIRRTRARFHTTALLRSTRLSKNR